MATKKWNDLRKKHFSPEKLAELDARVRDELGACSNASRYKATRPPRCLGGVGCAACKQKWESSRRFPKTFVIDRAKWVRTNRLSSKAGRSALKNREGNMCCLGHIATQCAVHLPLPTPLQRLALLPSDLPGPDFIKLLDFLTMRCQYGEPANTMLASDAAAINDDDDISDKTWEKKLKTLFKKHGYTLVFKGKYLDGELTSWRNRKVR